jgi:branched-chain amino acid transport system ATP-binding protein
VFTSLSVEDNLLLGAYARRAPDQRESLERVYADFPEIAEKRHQQASRLSGGQQQILAVAQGIMADPLLLILDEPSGGLAPIVVDRILTVAASLAERGLAILLVEQLVEKALKHAHYGYLLETGAIGGEGPAVELGNSDLLRRIYLGGSEPATA